MLKVISEIKNKTWKREVAAGLLAFLCYVAYTGDVEMAKVLVYPFTAFAALAYGLDWKGKTDASSFYRTTVRQEDPDEMGSHWT